jgi:GT2 family glycosyltransferase
VDTPRLSVVIINYCQWEGTAALTREILTTPAARCGAVEVLVVDNHSPAHRLAARLQRWPGVSLRRWGSNRGFARAVNEGSRLSRGQWVLLLNPDVTLTPGFVEGALALAERLQAAEPAAGIVGFHLRNPDGTAQLSSGPFPNLFRTLASLILPRSRRKYRARNLGERCQVPWVTGCCLLVRKDCLQDLGGLDNDFFLYYEDVDLCKRAQARGWSVWYEPSLRAVHYFPLHSRQVSPKMRLVTRHALLTYGSKHWPAWQFRLLAGIVRVEARLRKWWAWCKGDSQAGAYYGELRAIAAAMGQGRRKEARRRLRRVVRQKYQASVRAGLPGRGVCSQTKKGGITAPGR